MARRQPHERVQAGDRVLHASGLKHGVVCSTNSPVGLGRLQTATVDWDGEGREQDVPWGFLEVIP